jgi:WD40 repeat protein
VGAWQAHEGVIRGATFTPNGEQLLTCADDKTIKTWGVTEASPSSDTPLDTVICKYMVTGLSHARDSDQFATCGENTQLWAAGRTVPLRSVEGSFDCALTESLPYHEEATLLSSVVDPDPDPDPQGSETFCRIRIRNSRLWIQIPIRTRTGLKSYQKSSKKFAIC